jgi:hypothetical protein
MTRRVTLALLCVLTLSTACRQVLGLKHAHHQADAGATTPVQSLMGVPTDGVACEGVLGQACLDCREQKCQGDDVQCLTSGHCRADLDKYAICLGHTCSGDPEGCVINMKVSDPGLKQCLSACSDACRATPLVSPCELYCACMKQCPDELLGLDCIATCKTWPAELRNCRRDHCEWGKGDATHCKHASGALEACRTYHDLPLSQRTKVCLSGNESTWSCSHDSDCCSEGCSNGVCD